MGSPVIRIKDAWLLRKNASQYLDELWAEKDDKLADDDWMAKRVAKYKEIISKLKAIPILIIKIFNLDLHI